MSVPADPALQVGAADSHLAGQLLGGNIVQQAPGKTDISTLQVEVEHFHQAYRGEE